MMKKTKVDYILIPSGQKNHLLMLDGFTFAQMHSKRHWYCSRKKAGCKARIKMDTDFQTIIEAVRIHTHDPPEYHIADTGEYIFVRNYDYILIPSGQKNKILMLGGYTFAQVHSKRRWYCSRKKIGYYILIPSGLKKKLLMLGGFTFAQRSNRLWYCSRSRIGCKARIKMDVDEVTILQADNVHIHDPPQYHVTHNGDYVFVRTRYILIPSGQKNKLLMLGGFTFAQSSKRYWYCSKKRLGCKAKIKMAIDEVTILEAVNVHEHEPPQYHVTEKGEYVMIRSRDNNT
ncbi:hypothetical protein PYW08_016034 [Mythimna loreyi]|uniref:Uncharacterized protein n=1 Tax=Mythimna loreyi TaxID=667449 RepID=A0ACC2QSW5_9NEOP|nr:hypothetical protein PYW08_016034 [Mythimna loreyi]